MATRFRMSGKEWLILLILSDFDSEGEDIAHSFARSMRDDIDIHQIKPIKVALTRVQVEELGLPPILKAKTSSSRYEGFASENWDEVFEPEAVPPGQLQTILRNAIDSVIDVAAFNAEIEAEKRDASFLDAARRTSRDLLLNLGNAIPEEEP